MLKPSFSSNNNNITLSHLQPTSPTSMFTHNLISVDFSPSIIQAILLIFLSYLNDKTTITYLCLQSKTSSKCYCFFLLLSALFSVLLLFLIIGYSIHIIIQPTLLDWFSIMFFFISSIYFITESFYTRSNQTFEEEYYILMNNPSFFNQSATSNVYLNIYEFKKPLTTIQELKGEESKCTEEPLLKNSLVNYSSESDSKEENRTFTSYCEDYKAMVYQKINDFGNFAVIGMCAVYDYSAVVCGSLISLVSIVILSVIWSEDIGRNIKSKRISFIYGIVLVVYAVQLYFYKVFTI